MGIVLAAAALAVPPQPSAPQRQAQAVVRILIPAELHFSRIEQTHPRSLRSTTVWLPDRTQQAVRVVEFE